jgi:hypothetical protein
MMKNITASCFAFIVSLIFMTPIYAEVGCPEVPRVSAYEAYVKFKSGKAIVVQCGGITYKNRHIIGSIDAGSAEKVNRGQMKLPNFPRGGVEIFTY